jgi:hypothetical protein
MASRSKHERRPERGGDSLEAIKPLIVLVLFGTILYGAYSVVQKGSAAKPAGHADAPEAPAFAAPEIEVPAAPPAVVTAPPLAADAGLPLAPPPTVAAALPATAPGDTPLLPSPPAVPALPAEPAPVYLAAESAPPPAQEDVGPPPAVDSERPERLATLATAAPPPTALPPQMPPPPGTLPSSAAFATAWADAHDKLAAGRYAESLTALSVWYDDPSLGLEESHRLEDLLGQLAGTVIYSQQDLLLPPHVVAPGETLPAIAAQLGVSWQLLGKINGIADPTQLVPGEHLKLIRGPFDAVVSISRRRLSLQVGGAYAGSFPVVVGRQFLPRVGSTLPVADIRRDAPGQMADPAAGRRGILLADGLVIEAVDDPALVADDAAPTSLVVSARDLAELLDILGPGSSVLVRQ